MMYRNCKLVQNQFLREHKRVLGQYSKVKLLDAGTLFKSNFKDVLNMGKLEQIQNFHKLHVIYPCKNKNQLINIIIDKQKQNRLKKYLQFSYIQIEYNITKIKSKMQGEKQTFTNDLVLSEEQKEQDQIYGILQVRKQNMQVDWPNNHIHYNQHYYYSCQKFYVETDVRKRDIQLKGQLKVQGLKFIANVVGSYVYYDMKNQNVLKDVNKPAVVGTLTFEKTEKGINLTEVKLTQNGTPFDTYFSGELHMTKK